MYRTQPHEIDDVQHLIDIDLKCHDEPWTPDAWRRLAADMHIRVAVCSGRPVGFVAFTPTVGRKVSIEKLAVKSMHRRQGVGSSLLIDVLHYAENRRSKSVEIIVPETHLAPGRPYDVSEFLARNNFKAVVPFIRKHFVIDNEAVDGVKFNYEY